jgi:simple sugar transport system permease protein
VAFALPLAIQVFFSRTKPGLIVLAAGETPLAVRAQGYSVVWVRTACSVFSGAVAAAGGAVLTLSISHTFVEGLTAGRGFLALGIVVFARWRPLALIPASLLVGGATALQFRLQAGGTSQIPYAFFLAVPSLLSLFALAFASSRRGAPKALGSPAP